MGQRSTTDITVMELFKGAADQEELLAIGQFLSRNRFVVLPVAELASRQAVEILKRYALSHGLGIPDALIAQLSWKGTILWSPATFDTLSSSTA